MIRVLVIGLVLAIGCGDDEGGSTTSTAAPPKAGAKPAAKPKGKPKGPPALKEYVKVEDRVTEIERPTIRHEFRELDFRGDPTGLENRDPFRSYVVTLAGLDNGLGGNKGPSEQTLQCAPKELVATSYNLRDLRLVGIVTRGVNKYALFQDPSNYGHIINRRDCLGREKAKVKDIGAGFVTLEIIPEQSASAAPRPPEERSIPLYPNELKLGESDRDRGGDPGLAPPTMPTTGSEPVVPSDPVPMPPPVTEPAPTP